MEASIRIATLNVRTLQDKLKLTTTIQSARDLGFDILAMQEVRRTSIALVTFDDDSLEGWQLAWSGH